MCFDKDHLQITCKYHISLTKAKLMCVPKSIFRIRGRKIAFNTFAFIILEMKLNLVYRLQYATENDLTATRAEKKIVICTELGNFTKLVILLIRM
jgi:hypothetical protein